MITIPTFQQLYTSILSDIEAKFGNNVPTVGKNILRVIAAVQAGKLKLFYLSVGNLQKNIFVDTAEPESIGGTLERFGRVKLGRNPFPAVQGQYVIQVSGQVGGIISARTTFKSDDDSENPGKLFILDTEFTLVASTGNITVRALEAGVDSRLNVNETLTATIPIANVNRGAAVISVSVEAQAAEDIEEYREKSIQSYQTEPQGGSASDYRIWASDVQGVEQVYPYAASGQTAEINLYVEATIDDSTDGKGTPSSGMLDDVEAVVEQDPDTSKPLNERGRRPLGVFQINYLPVSVKEIKIQIADFVGITPTIETTIFNALESAINLIRPFVASADVLEDKNDTLDTNKIIAVILNARPGSVFGTVTLLVDSVGVSSYTFTNGDIPHLDEVNYP